MRKEKYIKTKKSVSANYYTVQFGYTDRFGQKKTYSKTFTSTNYPTERACFDAAVAHRDLKRAELIKGELVSKTQKTVSQCLKDYYLIKAVPVTTKEILQFNFDNYIADPYGDRTIDSITALDITECLESLKFDRSKNVISKVASVWRKIFKAAILQGVIYSSPMEAVETPRSKKPVKPRNQTMTVEDFNKLIDYLTTTGKNDRDCYENMVISYALRIVYYTGLRPQEVYALNRECVSLSKHTMTISESVGSTVDKRKDIIVPKTDASVRSIELSATCELVIRAAMEFSKYDYFLSNYHGKPFDPQDVSKRIHTVCARLHIDFHTYALRHNFSTTMIKANVDPRTVMELMGHSNVNTTLKYARSSDDSKQKAVDLVEKSRKQAHETHNKALN